MKEATALSQLGQRIQAPPISWLMQKTLGRPELISLAAGFTDNAALPVDAARECLNEVLRPGPDGQTALQYGSTQGDPTLRRATAQALYRRDGSPFETSPYQADRVIMTHGSEQLLYLLTEALCDPGDIVILEAPTYFVFLGALESHAVRLRGIPLDQDGVSRDGLEALLQRLDAEGELPRVKMLVLVPYYQNPTGLTTSFEKKQEILTLLRRYEAKAGHPIYLLEDAVYRELGFGHHDPPSALAIPEAGERAIYVGTYSKPFATGIRVGYGILPEPLLTVVTRIKGNHDFGTANLLQKALTRALESGRYAEHVALIQRHYARKAETMVSAIRSHFPSEVAWHEPTGGLYVWARLPESIRTGLESKLFARALEEEVLYVPGSLCYAADPTRQTPDSEMRLSFGAASSEAIQEGIARLGKVLKEFAS